MQHGGVETDAALRLRCRLSYLRDANIEAQSLTRYRESLRRVGVNLPVSVE